MTRGFRLLLPLLLGLAVLAWVLSQFDLPVVMASFTQAGIGGFAMIVLAGLAAEFVLS